MYDIICCIIFGFFIIIGISNTIYFLIESFFKSYNLDNKTINKDNIEYIIRSSKYCKNKHKIDSNKNMNREMLFISKRLIK